MTLGRETWWGELPAARWRRAFLHTSTIRTSMTIGTAVATQITMVRTVPEMPWARLVDGTMLETLDCSDVVNVPEEDSVGGAGEVVGGVDGIVEVVVESMLGTLGEVELLSLSCQNKPRPKVQNNVLTLNTPGNQTTPG